MKEFEEFEDFGIRGEDEELVLDLSALELPPSGDYTLRVVSAKKQESQRGTPMVVVHMVVEDDAVGMRATVTDFLPLSGPGVFRTRQALASMGLPETGLRLSDFQDRVCRARLERRDDPNFGERLSVKRYL